MDSTQPEFAPRSDGSDSTPSDQLDQFCDPEQSLPDREERLRFMTEFMPQKIFTAKPNGDVDYFNPPWSEFTGLSFEEIRDWGWTQFIHPDDVEENVRRWRRSIDTGEPFEFEHRFRRADGTYRWHLSRARVMRDEDGKALMWIGSNTDIDDQKRVEHEVERRARLAALSADIGVALTRGGTLREVLQRCAEVTVSHLEVAFARVWTLSNDVLELQASAGMYTHLDGAHSRVPVGELKIGRIARTQRPHLTNQVVGDPQVHEQEWATREGMVAFAGYPLVVDERTVGVLAMFARHPLADDTLQALASVADSIALGIGRQRAEAERDRAQDELEHQKDVFLSAIAHDLKNPIAVLQGQAQLLQRRAARNTLAREQVVNGLAMIEGRARMMTELIDELLDVTQLRMGQHLQLNRKCTDLVDLVRQSVVAEQYVAEGHHFVLAGTDSELIGFWDTARLARVLGNLLTNAVKYSSAGSEIRVTLSHEMVQGQAWACVAVRDHGLGIPTKDVPYIFDWFYRAGNVPGTTSGTGIGLAGAREIVARHGGTIEVESQEGIGSTFTVRLPVNSPNESS
ncbi:MAG: ATP-binding protein [Chloroflexota bacterium]|nr:ATP-binding protein [Chloroflexota bacterium]